MRARILFCCVLGPVGLAGDAHGQRSGPTPFVTDNGEAFDSLRDRPLENATIEMIGAGNRRSPIRVGDFRSIRIQRIGNAGRFFVLLPQGNRQCVAALWIDGVQQMTGRNADVAYDQLLDIHPDEIAAVEVYPHATTVPMELAGTEPHVRRRRTLDEVEAQPVTRAPEERR